MTDQLYLTDSELQDAWRTYHATRPSSQNVTIPKATLEHLLKDHHTLYTVAIEGKRLTVTAGADQRSLL